MPLRGSTAMRCWYFVDFRLCWMPASAEATASDLVGGGGEADASNSERTASDALTIEG